MDKKQKRQEVPPLSRLDKGIYIAIMVVCLLAAAALAFDWSWWGEKIFGEAVRTVALRREFSEFFAAFLIVAVLLVLVFTLHIKGFVERIPIFGNKNVKYGEYPWPKKLYPIFDERRKQLPMSAEKRRFWRGYAAIICLLLIYAFFISGPTICRRVTLEPDGAINAYNSFTPVSHCCTEDYECAEFRIYEHWHRFASYLTYELTLTCDDGRSYTFTREDMSTPDDALKTVLKIKEELSEEQFGIYRRDLLENLISEENIQAEEEALLRQIFE